MAEEEGVEPTRRLWRLNGFEGRAPHRRRCSSEGSLSHESAAGLNLSSMELATTPAGGRDVGGQGTNTAGPYALFNFLGAGSLRDGHARPLRMRGAVFFGSYWALGLMCLRSPTRLVMPLRSRYSSMSMQAFRPCPLLSLNSRTLKP